MAKDRIHRHIATVDGKKYSFPTADEYGDIKAIVGIQLDSDTNPTAADGGWESPKEGVKQGLLIKLRVSGTLDGKPASATNRRKTSFIYCARDRMKDAIGGLGGKSLIGGGQGATLAFKIRTCNQPKRVYLH